jgi:hypothetical protein
VLDSLSKKKLIDVVVLSIATLTVIGTYIAQESRIYARDSRIDVLEVTVKDNTLWRAKTEDAIESIARSMSTASARIDSAKEEILQQIDGNKQ